MNKFNKLGMELIEYKSELSKSYPQIVLKSLYSSVDSLAHNGIIDVDILYALKGEETPVEALKELLLNKTACIKTYDELLNEYEVIRNRFDEELEIVGNEDIRTQSVVENEKIVLVQDFIMTEEFIKNYFYIESEKEFETLMGRKGFLHKFAILRLEKILRDYIAECCSELGVTHSSVFHHESKNVYGIQLLFSYNIEDLENEELSMNLAIQTKELMDNAIEYYNRKMVA